jgi:hypothetical protein
MSIFNLKHEKISQNHLNKNLKQLVNTSGNVMIRPKINIEVIAIQIIDS